MSNISYNGIYDLATSKGYEFNVNQTIYFTNGSYDGEHISDFLELVLIQKWLIEMKNIYITVNHTIYAGDAQVSYWYPLDRGSTIDTRHKFKTYEEALLVGIEHGLNQLS